MMRKLRQARLQLRVHCEALCRSPRAYLTAMKWWVLRKRVRARAQLAPLLAQTSRAYEWWALQNENEGQASAPGTPAIVALVVGSSSAVETIASLAAESIVAHFVSSNPREGINRAANAINWAEQPWLLLIPAGDRIAPGAAECYRAEMGDPLVAAIYADDDLEGPFSTRTAPHFKPDWNPELFRRHDYLTGACVVRAGRDELIAAAELGPDWAHALVLSRIAGGRKVVHLHKVLHHRRRRPTPRLPLPALPIAPSLPRLSAIIPTRNRVDLLSKCVDGLMAANYREIEVIIVDNDSDDPATLNYLASLPLQVNPGRLVRVLRHPGPFNYSTINNCAVSVATGELVCLLNNDIEMLSPDWLGIMATQALRDDVGAVGAQLLYPDGRIQHAGVVVGVGNAAGHAHRRLLPQEEGYFRRHSLPQFVSAVTAACLVVQRDRFLAVGGLDEVNFPVAFNDVDLCLRLNAKGWQSFYEPRAVLVHHESVSRGFDRDPVGAARFARELAALQRRWQTDRIVDPYHHPQLSRASEQFTLAL